MTIRQFRRWMWGWFAVTSCPYDINELIEGIGHAGAQHYSAFEQKGRASDG